MSYQEQNDLYRGPRGRYEMCIREQGLEQAASPDPASAELGRAVTSGDLQAIDSVIASICVGPFSDSLIDDEGLKAAVQAAWPTVAAATHGEEPAA